MSADTTNTPFPETLRSSDLEKKGRFSRNGGEGICRRRRVVDKCRLTHYNYRLHALKGEWRGYGSVTVNANRRIVFRFEGEDAHDVELIDYH